MTLDEYRENVGDCWVTLWPESNGWSATLYKKIDCPEYEATGATAVEALAVLEAALATADEAPTPQATGPHVHYARTGGGLREVMRGLQK